MSYLLALDQGTGSSRAILFDTAGKIISRSQKVLASTYPHPGWVEQDPEQIWETQLAAARAAVAAAAVPAGDISAIGIVNQRETTILWDRASGRPLAPAIVWQDRRTADECRRMRGEGLEPLVRERTGLVLDPYFSATKIAWLLDRIPGARTRAKSGELAFGTVDSWLVWRLTGGRVHATDVGNAARTLLFDIRRLKWDPELCELFRVPVALLPEVRPSAGDFGSARIGNAEIAIRGVAGDQQAALLGQVCLEPGQAKNTYGTGAFVVINTGSVPVAGEGVLSTVAWQVAGRPAVYALEGAIFAVGAAVQWLRDELGVICDVADIECLAAQVPDSGGVYFVPALAGLGAPFWDPYARGTIVGLTQGSTAAHLARAVLEAIAFRTRDILRAMESIRGEPLGELRVDGGASRNDLLMQIQAEVIGVPVLRPAVTETTALGAAMLAGIGAGVMEPRQLRGVWRAQRVFRAALDGLAREQRYRQWLRACERARAWVE